MASAQVLPNSAASSRKQEHLEAGKRRLEEFRKKKAAERAKKAASSSTVKKSDAGLNQNQTSEVDNVRVDELDGATTSDGIGRAVIDTSTSGMSNEMRVNLIGKSGKQGSLADKTSLAENYLHTPSTSFVEEHPHINEATGYNSSAISASADVSQNIELDKASDRFGIHAGGIVGVPYGTTNNQSILPQSQKSQEFDIHTNKSSPGVMNENYSSKSNSSLKNYAVTDHGSFPHFPTKISPENSVDSLVQNKPTNSSLSDSGYSHGLSSGGISDSYSSRFRETFTNTNNDLPSLHGSTVPRFDSTAYEARNLFNNTPIHSVSPESTARRSRPSFLDSLNVTRPSTGSPFQQPEQDSSMSNHIESGSNNVSGSTYFHKPSEENKIVLPFSDFTSEGVHSPFGHLTNSSGFNSYSQDAMIITAKESDMEKKHDYYVPSKNEDFVALEQHIEDLTQEKFSLQRAVEASRVLAESLSSENSSLTDNYNKQRSVVNQLKLDMEKLQEEIKVQLVELESIRNEYTNAQLECNAADERAKLLASEVIGLEEKALRLRSHELKLEKQLENAEAEISSYRKKMSSLDKDRHDLLSTIDALQEEKKVLQSKLRKASDIGKSIENQISKKDVSTSTKDLVEDVAASSLNAEINDSAALRDVDASSSGVFPVNIPHDQMRMIENINAIISELALEKEELMKALISESSECSRMKDINKELSQKLEVQTQRLELLAAQSMVNENIPGKQLDSHAVYETIPPYADEGDEVVERVLGWIMKLFPGGPSRRRTSKLL